MLRRDGVAALRALLLAGRATADGPVGISPPLPASDTPVSAADKDEDVTAKMPEWLRVVGSGGCDRGGQPWDDADALRPSAAQMSSTRLRTRVLRQQLGFSGGGANNSDGGGGGGGGGDTVDSALQGLLLGGQVKAELKHAKPAGIAAAARAGIAAAAASVPVSRPQIREISGSGGRGGVKRRLIRSETAKWSHGGGDSASSVEAPSATGEPCEEGGVVSAAATAAAHQSLQTAAAASGRVLAAARIAAGLRSASASLADRLRSLARPAAAAAVDAGGGGSAAAAADLLGVLSELEAALAGAAAAPVEPVAAPPEQPAGAGSSSDRRPSRRRPSVGAGGASAWILAGLE